MDESQETRSRSLAERIARGDLFEVGCPSREVMRHVTSSWGVLVLIALQSGTHRFSSLRRKVNGVSERMLAQTLQSLERDHLVERRSFPVVPPHVEYTLTPLGQEAAEKVAALADWVEERLPQILGQSPAASAAAPSHPVEPTPSAKAKSAGARVDEAARRGESSTTSASTTS